jgi:hypothetical protein
LRFLAKAEVIKGMIEKKKIELEKTRDVVARFDEVPSPIITARQFVVMYYDALKKSGKSLKALHNFLLANGIDVGTYESFRTAYSRVKRAQEKNPSAPITAKGLPKPQAPEPSKAPMARTEEQKEAKTDAQGANAEETESRPRGVGLRPIFLADGTEIEIDPETGARLFKIKSNRRKRNEESNIRGGQ